MRHALNTLMCALVGTVLCSAARAEIVEPAETEENPYQAIVDRNVFGLRPPPPPPSTEPPKAPPPKFTLTGISTLMGQKKVFLKAPGGPAKPGEPAKGDEYYMLPEGGEDGELKVLQIDERHGLVKINYAGIVSTLDFTNNGAKAIAAAPVALPAGVPGQPPPGGIPAPAPGAITRPLPAAPGTVPMPTRTLRLPTATPTGTVAPGTTPGYSGVGSAGGVYTANQYASANVLTTPPGTTPTTTAATTWQNSVPVEQQFIMVEAERERTRNAVASGMLPPLPPTPLTQPGSAGVQQPVQQQMPQLPPRAPGLPALPQ